MRRISGINVHFSHKVEMLLLLLMVMQAREGRQRVKSSRRGRSRGRDGLGHGMGLRHLRRRRVPRAVMGGAMRATMVASVVIFV